MIDWPLISKFAVGVLVTVVLFALVWACTDNRWWGPR